MSMVVFPFKDEDPGVAVANLETATAHPRVERVLAVGAERNALFRRMVEAAAAQPVPTEVAVQDRIGIHRPGKGDGMNTAMRRFLDTDLDRLHFYDADITNFDAHWIEGAERAADAGYAVVRHYFPRASTDAMVTWMVTRPLFALGHPGSGLWRIRQPLGGELLMSRSVVEKLVSTDAVTERSDWGIDTLLTYATAATGEPMYEHYVPDGKQHTLYGSLAELADMVHECFEAALTVADLPPPPAFAHTVEPDAPAPPVISHRVGYDVESTLGLLVAPWTEAELEAASRLPSALAGPVLGNRDGPPSFARFDADIWYETLTALRGVYRPEQGWRRLLFRLWVARVLAYTTTDALAGHTRAMELLEEAVADYASRSEALS